MPALNYEYGRESPLSATTVSEVITGGVINCTPDTSLRTVAKLMATYRVHAIFVFDYSHGADDALEPWGLVSDLDLVAGARRPLDERTAGESAVAPLITVLGSDTLERAAELMAANSLCHLPVVDPSTPRPVGVISTLDIARELASPGHRHEARPASLH